MDFQVEKEHIIRNMGNNIMEVIKAVKSMDLAYLNLKILFIKDALNKIKSMVLEF